MNPTIPEDEVAILKQQHLQAVAQQKASPQFVANRTFRTALFGEHPYARTSETEASLNAMDRAKLVAFHRDHYRPEQRVPADRRRDRSRRDVRRGGEGVRRLGARRRRRRRRIRRRRR